MSQLDTLRQHGWSYWAGYSHDFKSYVARAWKPRYKPERKRFHGGGDAILLTYCISETGATLEEAALAVYEKVIDGNSDGSWWSGLPVTKIAH